MPKPQAKSSFQSNDMFHLGLIILCCVGFLVLYFKVDLDGSLNATYIANVSQQVERVERRVRAIEDHLSQPSAQMPAANSLPTQPPANQ